MFQRIFCATDFSARAERAIEHATAWAARSGGSLELLYVLEPTLFMAPELTPMYVEIEETSRRELEARMEAEVAALRGRVPHTSGRVRLGMAGTEILEQLEQSKPDLVVIGTHGHGFVARAILGSVADRVLRGSTAPVLVVPSEERDVQAIPTRLVVPTDFSAPARAAVRRAVALGKALGAAVTVLHAYEIPPFVDVQGDLAKNVRASMARQIAEEHRELVDPPCVVARAVEGVAAKVIVSTTEELHADLVVMASTGRGLLSAALLGGVTDRVLRTSHVPVLVLRESAF